MGLGVYSISPAYKNLYTTAAENSSEVILDIQYIKGSLANDIFKTLGQQSMSSSSLYVPTKVMVDAYQMTNGLGINDVGSGFDPINPYNNRDPRLKYSVFVPGDVLPNGQVFNPKPTSTTGDAVGSTFTVSPTGFNVKKYVNAEDLTTTTNCGINLILMRYAEILLTYAEAKIELNQLDPSVYTAINQIRGRADVLMPAITAGKTQAQLRTIVRQERLVELAFEGLRFFDIRRWRIAETVMPGKVFGMTYVNPLGALTTVEVTGWLNYWDNKYYLWPIPQLEKDLNPKLGQNTGY
jgi:starch-binding outer membrane protein, SusD/RagB family